MSPLTARMRAAHGVVIGHVACHGVTPSVRALAAELRCAPNNAQRLIGCLIERGALRRIDGGGLAIGAGGTAFVLSPSLAARLCAFALKHGEDVTAVLADAVALHLDAVERETRR